MNSYKESEEFIGKFITMDKSLLPKALHQAQTLKHSCTCRKKGQSICRVYHPLLPIKKTTFLKPLKDVKPSKVLIMKNKAKNIFAYLKDLVIKIKTSLDDSKKNLNNKKRLYFGIV